MSVTLQQQWSNTGSGGATPSCTVSGATPGNLLVAFCEVREEVVTITGLAVDSSSVANGWTSGSSAGVVNLERVAIGHKATAAGTSADNIAFAATGPSNLYGWSVVVYEFNFTLAGYSYATSTDATEDTTWSVPPDDWPSPSGQSVGLALIIGGYATADQLSSPYNRTNNPNGFTWDSTWNNYERTVVYGSTYYYKYSIGYVVVATPGGGNEPGFSMTFGGSNIDNTVTLWLVGAPSGNSGYSGLLQFTF